MIWYCLHVRPNREGRAYRDLSEQGYAVFSPLEIVTVRRRNARGQMHTHKRERPLCRGYIFIAGYAFPSSRYIFGPLQFEGRPVPISDDELAPLHALHNTEREIATPKRGMVLNQIVTVAVGRLAGVTGRAVIIDGARVVIETEFLGAKRTATVGRNTLEAV